MQSVSKTLSGNDDSISHPLSPKTNSSPRAYSYTRNLLPSLSIGSGGGLQKHGHRKHYSRTSTIIWIVICMICFAIGRLSNTYIYSTSPCIINDSSSITKLAAHKKQTTGTKKKKMDISHIKSMRRAAQDLVNMLKEYYNGKEQAEKMMLGSWLSPWEFNSTDKLVDTMTRAIVNEEQDEFIIGIIGSSVAAGNGNCHYDNYPNQLERTLSSVWKAAGMKLVIQNTGCGACGDSYSNEVYCIQQSVSPQVDIVQYTWTLYESDKSLALESRESLIRWTQMMIHQPPVHVLNIQELPENRSSEEYQLAEHYSQYGYNALYAKSSFDYEGTEMFIPKHVGDGLHNTTRYGMNETKTRRDSLGVMMRNWHPGPLYFQFIADTYSYIYSRAILVALDVIESQISNYNRLEPGGKWTERPIVLKDSLPTPKYCNPLYCVVGGPPKCLKYSIPKYGQWGARVEDVDDDLNPHKGELQRWTVYEDNSSIIGLYPKEDRAFFKNRNETHRCEHKWSCNGIIAQTNDSGSVVFRLPSSEVGLVVICGMGKGNIGNEMFISNTGIEIKYNGQVLNSSTFDVWPHNKCVRLLKKFTSSSAVAKTGHEYLAIKILNLTEDREEPFGISHVITL